MKFAVITLHRVYNYGSALQAYATQRTLEKYGETVVIDYITPERTFLATLNRTEKHGLKGVIYRMAKLPSLILKEATFGRFINKNLKLTKKYITASDIDKCPPEADVYVTGSDQVWNSKYNGVDRGFYLDFIPKDKKRVAFVASFGKTELDEKEAAEVKPYLSHYSALSVREDSAVTLLEKLGFDSTWLIDPTLLLRKEEWRALSSKRLVKEKYLILMLLYNEDNGATDYARRLADEKGLKLVKISWQLRCPEKVDKLFTHRPPSDFLSLFDNAEFVVTNSFHGTAFSINLEKQFIVVPRSEFNSRIESLLRLTGLSDRLVDSVDKLSVANEVIDYTKVLPILEKERERAHEFIKKEICGDK